MTIPATSTSTPARFEDRFAGWLTTAVTRPAVRAALRAGSHPATHERAFPYLAPWWKDKAYLQEPLLLASAVLAQTGVPHAPGVTLARCASRAAKHASGKGMDTRINIAYRQPLEHAHAQFTAILRVAASKRVGVDYADVVRTYTGWDSPYGRDIRRRLLSDYYAAPLLPSKSETDPSTDTTEG